MKNLILNSIIIFSFLLLLGCKSDNVEGVILENTLVVHQDYSENRRMVSLIKSSLNNDSEAFNNLINFSTGGGESSYNLGYVITQIIYRNGEIKTIEMIKNYDKRDLNYLDSYIGVGLEYGDNDYDGKMDNTRFNGEFSKLYKYIKERID